MNIAIEFSNPYTRAQVKTGLGNLTLPTDATVAIRTSPREGGLNDVVDADTDSIEVLKITNFTNFLEIAEFVNSMPGGAFARISRISVG